ncbi:MAG TPA: hypothetical protein VFW27_07355 [Actinoplanes sp.]|jgi:hypothetical protein|nr:hypothetical protein [Actinoplanes sp.]
MLLLIDLDNTLIDRRAAFKGWAESRFGQSEVPWLVEADRDGYEDRLGYRPAVTGTTGMITLRQVLSAT